MTQYVAYFLISSVGSKISPQRELRESSAHKRADSQQGCDLFGVSIYGAIQCVLLQNRSSLAPEQG